MKMAMNPNLPQEILLDIFSRLPTKSIGKCRCLSKPWRAQLSTPNFIKLHFTRQTHEEKFILISESAELHTISTFDADDGVVLEKLNLSNTWSAVVGSCNGLVLLLNKQENLYLVNPITCEQVKVPDSPLSLPKQGSKKLHGFGYDSSSDDYKIVTLSHRDTGPFPLDTFVDVYSVKLGVWRRLDDPSPYKHTNQWRSSGVCVNGAIHSLAERREPGFPFVITAFDLAYEDFYEISDPIDDKWGALASCTLVTFEGCLCMMNIGVCGTDIWMLNDYNDDESWTKIFVYLECVWDIYKPLCFIKDEEVVLLFGTWELLVHNFKEKDLVNLVVNGNRAQFADGGTFTESLISPFSGNVIEDLEPPKQAVVERAS